MPPQYHSRIYMRRTARFCGPKGAAHIQTHGGTLTIDVQGKIG